jgi:hypothetical protein
MLATAATAQTPAKPAAKAAPAQAAPAAPAAPTGPTYHVDGFRSAQFGMTQDQVRAAIAKDFNVQPSSIIVSQNPLENTTALSVKVDHLDPGPVPAVATYIFGASKKTLMHINVVWTTEAKPTDAQRGAIIQSALQLTAYFQGQPWPPKHVAGGVLLKSGSFMLFGGVDDKNGAVEIVTTGVPLENGDPKGPKLPEPVGPAQLLISYSADTNNPDVAKIPQGAF